MNKKYALKQFNQFLPMIEKACWHYSKKYSIDHSEIEGQAFLVFCEALKSFDKSLGNCFSTHLTNKLKRLDAYCKTMLRRNQSIQKYKNRNNGYLKTIRTPLLNITENNAIYDYCIFDRVISKMDYEISLSSDAKEIVKYILSREWEDVNANWIPRLNHVQKVFIEKGWNKNKVLKAWNEVKEWWRESNKDQFCLEV